MQSKYRGLFLAILLVVVGVLAFNMFYEPEQQQAKYTREATRKTIDLANTEFVRNLKHGNSFVNLYFGGTWFPMVMPIQENYQGLLKEKIVFLREEENINDYSELVVLDTYTTEAFPNISSFLKKHAQTLNKKNKNGRIKILHDGTKGIMYQWAVIDKESQKTQYMEFGWVEMTNEGLLSVKYINKGTNNLEMQRQKAIKFFSTFVN